MLSIVATEPNCCPNFTFYDQYLEGKILYLLDVSKLKQNIDPIDRRFLIKIIVIQY